jgi:CheY-like chemotaxis protein
MALPILVIEDSDSFFFIISKAFRYAGVNNPIIRSETGDEALAYLFREGVYSDPSASPRPGIILLDLRLPGTGGREILRAVKTSPALKTIPVVILTSSTKEADVTGCYQDGANSFISKPQSPQQTAEMIQRLASYWLDTVRLPNRQPAMKDADSVSVNPT